MKRTRLTDVLEAYAGGQATAAEVVEVAGVTSLRPGRPTTLISTTIERDPKGLTPGTWDEVTHFHNTHRITDEQYEELWAALHHR